MMLSGLRKDLPKAAVLCSYAFIDRFDRWRDSIAFRDWSMDSGAFTAHHQGRPVDLDEFIEACQERLANDPQLIEVFALDDLADPEITRRNTERMWEAGVQAIPCYHYGEPEEYLRHYARTYPKIALGGVAKLHGGEKQRLIRQCFARIWPKLVHGFGITTEADVMCAPWDSVHSSSWQAPAQYGTAKAFRSTRDRVRRMRGNYRAMARPEIDWYLDFEQRARARWRRHLEDALQATREKFPDYDRRETVKA